MPHEVRSITVPTVGYNDPELVAESIREHCDAIVSGGGKLATSIVVKYDRAPLESVIFLVAEYPENIPFPGAK